MNLTDTEIIKALKCCFLSECTCEDCPYSYFEICDTAKMINTVIDLINRQKAEIEDLKHSEEVLYRVKEDLKAQIKGLQDEVEIKTNMYNYVKTQRDEEYRCCMYYVTMIAKIKTEAIKEFWDRLKKEKITHKNFGEIVCVEDGDNLVKELIEKTDFKE